MIRARTFVVRVQDRPGVLNRVTSLCRRRAYNIDWLTVGPSAERGISQIMFGVRADDDGARKLEANLLKLIEVISVDDEGRVPCVVRELALVKVAATTESKAILVRLCRELPARIAATSSTALTIELVGSGEQVAELLAALVPFGLLEIVRTAVAVTRDDDGAAGETAAAATSPGREAAA